MVDGEIGVNYVYLLPRAKIFIKLVKMERLEAVDSRVFRRDMTFKRNEVPEMCDQPEE